MKRQIIMGTMLSAVLATGVAAQQPPASGDPGARPAQSSDSAQTITVTGCLAAASASPSTAPGAGSPSAGASGGFELKNATTGTMAKGSSPAGAPGAAPGATGTSGAAGTTYKLVGGDSEDLQKNVGKKVEVTGSVAARGSSSAPGSAAGAASGSSASGQSFQVKSIRATGDSCGM
jgi:collagen type I alpha